MRLSQTQKAAAVTRHKAISVRMGSDNHPHSIFRVKTTSSAVMDREKRITPGRSTLSLREGLASSCSARYAQIVATTPTGRLIRKIRRQLATLRISPPSTGPIMLPSAQVIELIPIARPRSSGGNTSVMRAMPLAISMAPPIPCSRRNITSSRPVLAKAQSTEQAVKARKPRLYMRTRPKRSARRPKMMRKIVFMRM